MRQGAMALVLVARRLRARRLVPRLGGACLLVALLGGCSSNEHVEVGLSSGSWGIVRAPAARELRATVAPLEVASDALAKVAGRPFSRGVEIEAALLRQELTEAVRASGLFATVREADFVSDLRAREAAAVTSRATAGAAPVGLDEVLDGAYRRDDDVVVSFSVRRHAVAYVERNGWGVPNLLNYVVFVWTAWYVADEVYEGELALTATIRASGSGAVLWTRDYGRTVRRDLDHFERGWKFFGSFTVPESLEDEDYEKIGKVVQPYARLAVAQDLARDLAAIGPLLLSDEGAALARKTLGVVVGVERHAGAVPEAPHAADDARDVAALLVDPELVGAIDRTVSVLVDERATRAAILDALGAAARRAQVHDTVVAYFAGLGAAIDGEPCLVPADADPARAESLVPLAEVARVLAGSAARRRIVVVDASFGGEGAEPVRTLALPGRAPANAEQLARAVAQLGKQATLVLACEPGSGARALRPDRHGLLTAALRNAAEDARLQSGERTLQELFAVARASVDERAAKAGFTQVPAIVGDRAGEVVFVHGRRSR